MFENDDYLTEWRETVIDEVTAAKKRGVELPDVLDQIDQYLQNNPESETNPRVFIHFTNLLKVGTNPRQSYNTPIGIFAYPLNKEIMQQYREQRLPFMGDSKYVFLFAARPGKNVIYNNISREQFMKYVLALKSLILEDTDAEKGIGVIETSRGTFDFGDFVPVPEIEPEEGSHSAADKVASLEYSKQFAKYLPQNVNMILLFESMPKKFKKFMIEHMANSTESDDNLSKKAGEALAEVIHFSNEEVDKDPTSEIWSANISKAKADMDDLETEDPPIHPTTMIENWISYVSLLEKAGLKEQSSYNLTDDTLDYFIKKLKNSNIQFQDSDASGGYTSAHQELYKQLGFGNWVIALKTIVSAMTSDQVTTFVAMLDKKHLDILKKITSGMLKAPGFFNAPEPSIFTAEERAIIYQIFNDSGDTFNAASSVAGVEYNDSFDVGFSKLLVGMVKATGNMDMLNEFMGLILDADLSDKIDELIETLDGIEVGGEEVFVKAPGPGAMGQASAAGITSTHLKNIFFSLSNTERGYIYDHMKDGAHTFQEAMSLFIKALAQEKASKWVANILDIENILDIVKKYDTKMYIELAKMYTELYKVADHDDDFDDPDEEEHDDDEDDIPFQESLELDEGPMRSGAGLSIVTFRRTIKDGIEDARNTNDLGLFWNITRKLGHDISRKQKTKSPSNLNRTHMLAWGQMLRRLGIDGVVDLGASLIHSNEPTQAVFFGGQAIRILGTFQNPHAKQARGLKKGQKDGDVPMKKTVSVALPYPKWYETDMLAHFGAAKGDKAKWKEFAKGQGNFSNYDWSHSPMVWNMTQSDTRRLEELITWIHSEGATLPSFLKGSKSKLHQKFDFADYGGSNSKFEDVLFRALSVYMSSYATVFPGEPDLFADRIEVRLNVVKRFLTNPRTYAAFTKTKKSGFFQGHHLYTKLIAKFESHMAVKIQSRLLSANPEETWEDDGRLERFFGPPAGKDLGLTPLTYAARHRVIEMANEQEFNMHGEMGEKLKQAQSKIINQNIPKLVHIIRKLGSDDESIRQAGLEEMKAMMMLPQDIISKHVVLLTWFMNLGAPASDYNNESFSTDLQDFISRDFRLQLVKGLLSLPSVDIRSMNPKFDKDDYNYHAIMDIFAGIDFFNYTTQYDWLDSESQANGLTLDLAKVKKSVKRAIPDVDEEDIQRIVGTQTDLYVERLKEKLNAKDAMDDDITSRQQSIQDIEKDTAVIDLGPDSYEAKNLATHKSAVKTLQMKKKHIIFRAMDPAYSIKMNPNTYSSLLAELIRTKEDSSYNPFVEPYQDAFKQVMEFNFEFPPEIKNFEIDISHFIDEAASNETTVQGARLITNESKKYKRLMRDLVIHTLKEVPAMHIFMARMNIRILAQYMQAAEQAVFRSMNISKTRDDDEDIAKTKKELQEKIFGKISIEELMADWEFTDLLESKWEFVRNLNYQIIKNSPSIVRLMALALYPNLYESDLDLLHSPIPFFDDYYLHNNLGKYATAGHLNTDEFNFLSNLGRNEIKSNPEAKKLLAKKRKYILETLVMVYGVGHPKFLTKLSQIFGQDRERYVNNLTGGKTSQLMNIFNISAESQQHISDPHGEKVIENIEDSIKKLNSLASNSKSDSYISRLRKTIVRDLSFSLDKQYGTALGSFSNSGNGGSKLKESKQNSELRKKLTEVLIKSSPKARKRLLESLERVILSHGDINILLKEVLIERRKV